MYMTSHIFFVYVLTAANTCQVNVLFGYLCISEEDHGFNHIMFSDLYLRASFVCVCVCKSITATALRPLCANSQCVGFLTLGWGDLC